MGGLIFGICLMTFNHLFTLLWFNSRISKLEASFDDSKGGDE